MNAQDANSGKKSTPNVNQTKANNASNTHHDKQRAKSTPVETEQDLECLRVTKKKDYYEILEVSKNADENELKKAYKKVNR